MDRAEAYRREVEMLFRTWKEKNPLDGMDHQHGIFIRDGVVCPERWFSQTVRPLFLLKEAYHGDGDWDLIADHLLTEGKIGRHTIWKRISQWTRGLMLTTEDCLYPYADEAADHVFGNPYLRQAAVVNVKKSGGEKVSDYKEIQRYAEYDRRELRREIELIDPTVIVCGYTISALNIIMETPVKEYANAEQQNSNLFYTVQINGHAAIVLDYWRPSNQFPDLLNYYGLMGSYQQALLHRAKG